MKQHFQSGAAGSTDEEIYDLFVLGGLDAGEPAEVKAHLARGCESCAAGVARAQTRWAALALTLPEETPSADVKRRLLTAVRPAAVAAEARVAAGPGWNWIWGGMAAAFAVLAAVLGLRAHAGEQATRNLRGQVASSQQQLQQALDQNRQLRVMTDIMTAPATRTLAVMATPQAPREPQARAFVNPQRGVVLIASQLAPAAPGKTYEMWLLPAKGNPVAAGTFQTSSAGGATHTFAQALLDVAGVAVSVEPDGGSAQPTGAIVLAAKLPTN